MNDLQKSMFTCTTCGHTFEVSFGKSYKSSDTPSIKEKILADRLFKYPCPQCQEVFDIEYEFTYHNPERKYIIWLQLPYQEKSPLHTLPPYKKFEIAPKEYKYRIVNSREELSEKIKIFDANLDDKVIELIKLGILVDRNQEDFPIKSIDFYTLMTEVDPDEFTDDLGFTISYYGLENDVTIISRNEYIAHAKLMASDFADFLLDTGEWEVINKKTIIEYEKMKKQYLQEIIGKWEEICILLKKQSPTASALAYAVKQIRKSGQILQLYVASEILAEKFEKVLPEITKGIVEVLDCEYIVQILVLNRKN